MDFISWIIYWFISYYDLFGLKCQIVVYGYTGLCGLEKLWFMDYYYEIWILYTDQTCGNVMNDYI